MTAKIDQLTSSYKDWLVESLQDKEAAAHYLQVALDEYDNDNDAKALLLALRHVAEAQGGLGILSNKTHLNRENLYRTLSSNGNPKLKTLGLLLKGLGFRIFIKPA